MDPVPVSVWQPRPKFQDRRWRHALLFALTIATTSSFGWAYCATILTILGCHELGHYLACRYYDVDASLPYFLPFLPAPYSLTGTLGAFIRIREPIRYKRWLFDIGIAGPLAGFAIAVPTLFVGLALSHFEPLRSGQGVFLGEPLLLKFFSWIIWGRVPDSETLVLHPMAFAAWFGLLATALNLFPIGQLDGGHISYTVFGRRSTYVTFATIGVAIYLSYRSASWIVWTVVVTGMLYAFGVNHPPVLDEDVPLDATRKVLAVLALVIFALCFTPAPIQQLFAGR